MKMLKKKRTHEVLRTTKYHVIFFVLAGARLQLSSFLLIGLSGVGYTFARILGKIAGAWFGARRLGAPPVVKNYLGVTFVAHAGVAIGLALQSQKTFPQDAEVIAVVILGSVLINEVVGPVMTRFAITRAGESREERSGAFQSV
ncbi:MAG TPA: hypothetical protein VFY29_17075 [Terriglobia bacterium]|nr:hypothetical protein [Terriglobia bacterium]